MRLERVTRIPRWPLWSVVIVGVWLTIVGANAYLAPWLGLEAPILCTFRRATGYPCATCGGTRMTMAFLRGDFTLAVWHNPLLFAVLVSTLIVLGLRVACARRITWTSTRTSQRLMVLAIVAAVAGNWVYLLMK